MCDSYLLYSFIKYRHLASFRRKPESRPIPVLIVHVSVNGMTATDNKKKGNQRWGQEPLGVDAGVDAAGLVSSL